MLLFFEQDWEKVSFDNNFLQNESPTLEINRCYIVLLMQTCGVSKNDRIFKIRGHSFSKYGKFFEKLRG